MRGSFNFHRLILRIVRAWRITSIYRDPLNYYLRWRFVSRYKNNGIFRVSSSLSFSLSPYISRCQKMSERVVSGDRWRCGRSSNKARGINRNVGWFFIGGCFSRCRREGLSRPYRPTELVRGLFRVVRRRYSVVIHLATREKKKTRYCHDRALSYLAQLTCVLSFSRLASLFREDTQPVVANEISQKSYEHRSSKGLLNVGDFYTKRSGMR